MVAARRDVVNADSSETAGPDSAHPKTASDKTMGASKATKKGSSMYKLDEGRSPFTDLAIGVLPQLEAVKLETPRAARTGGQSKRISTGAGGADVVTAADRALPGPPTALGPPPAAADAPARLGGGDGRRRLAFFAAAAAACSARLGSAAGPLGSPLFAAAAPFLSAAASLRCTAGGVRALSSASGICAAKKQCGLVGGRAVWELVRWRQLVR